MTPARRYNAVIDSRSSRAYPSLRMRALALAAALVSPALASPAALRKPAPKPLPAQPPVEEGRVLVDSDSAPDEAPAPKRSTKGVHSSGVGRVLTLDLKTRRLGLQLEDGVQLPCQVPESARLTFAPDERPLHLDQLRRGDAVSYDVSGSKVTSLHLLLGEEAAADESDAFQRPAPRGPRFERAPPPPLEDEEAVEPGTTADEPDTPMYQSEPPAPTKKR